MPDTRRNVKVEPEVHALLLTLTPKARTFSQTIHQALGLLEDERVVRYALRIKEGRRR